MSEYAILGLAAETVDDLESVRIANENRLRSLTDPKLYGLDVRHPDVAALAVMVEQLKETEAAAVKNLQKRMRKHPLGPWVKQATGVGEKQAARLLASIGDPYWNSLHDRPRTVSELWSYCGYGDASRQVRRKGVQANWNSDAKVRAFLIATSCVKSKGVYRDIYDEARRKYADAVHTSECKRCGPAGKPAQPGSPLSLGHQHARALRAISKAVLKDMWLESKRLHETSDTQEAMAA
ncbi:hypothetical protein SEA_CONCEPTII_74 [Mycobacterium phage ConceptII]|nr:hypothetical protein SEA_CONCEPTII_74 [Mycobacterium phage ConceptII]